MAFGPVALRGRPTDFCLPLAEGRARPTYFFPCPRARWAHPTDSSLLSAAGWVPRPTASAHVRNRFLQLPPPRSSAFSSHSTLRPFPRRSSRGRWRNDFELRALFRLRLCCPVVAFPFLLFFGLRTLPRTSFLPYVWDSRIPRLTGFARYLRAPRVRPKNGRIACSVCPSRSARA